MAVFYAASVIMKCIPDHKMQAQSAGPVGLLSLEDNSSQHEKERAEVT